MRKTIIATAAISFITMGGLSTVAFADTTAGSITTHAFDKQYQANLSAETQLLQQAQSNNSTNTTVTALLTAVQSINQEINTLYGVEQALSAAKSSIPTANPQEEDYKDELAKLEKQRQDLLNQSNNEWKLVNQYVKHHNKTQLNSALKTHNETEKKLTAVDNEIKGLENKINSGDWKNHPYDGGLTEIQDSILRLQASAIHYTKEAIALSGSANAAVTSASGSTNTSSGVDTSTTSSTSDSTSTATSSSVSSTTGGGN